MKSKPQKIEKKLFLNKTTIVNLIDAEMAEARAGGFDKIECSRYCPSSSESPNCSDSPSALT